MASYRIPGPLGGDTHSAAIDEGTLVRARLLPNRPLSIDLLTGAGSQLPAGLPKGYSGSELLASVLAATPHSSFLIPATSLTITALDNDTRVLAATAYGEGSSRNVFEEMAAIANVLVRQREARGFKSDAAYIQTDKTFAFAAHDGNPRYERLMKSSLDDINADGGMAAAVRGALNARSDAAQDYANGGWFWDGADIKTNYAKHAKVLAGIHFSDAKHNIYAIQEKDVPGEAWWFDANGRKTKSRGAWKYVYVSTAAWGGTIFWKYNSDFLRATGNKAHL
jgi:hypothetical protein